MKNKEIMLKNKNELKNLEQEYINDKILQMPKYLEEQKEKITKEIIEYTNNHTVPCKWDKEGNPIAYKVQLNPLVITNYFFKPITNISCVEPMYSPEQLGLMFDYYCYLVAEINEKIGSFPTSITSFCKLCSLTLNTLRSYKNSSDLNMRIIAEKIYDQIGDENITMSQMGIVKERSTIFKMKSQNELVEKQQPKVSINITEQPDMDRINERLDKYKKYAKKKG
ncbi:MAG: hypothetical protein J6C46_08555 [Clostridia bacterium]|nr:hypothetical protein [Clostridia bacterium]